MKALKSKRILIVGDTQDLVVEAIADRGHVEGASVGVIATGAAADHHGLDGVVFVTPARPQNVGLGLYLQSTIDAAERAAGALDAVQRAGDRSIVIVGRPADDDVRLTLPGSGALGGALRGLSRGWAVGLGDLGIRSNYVQPGLAHTPDPDGWTVPLEREDGRCVLPRDLADVVVYLLSEDAGYVTGAEFDVDGGLSEARRSLPGAAWSKTFAENKVT